MKYMLYMLLFWAAISGCVPQTECYRQLNDQGQTVITCPRMEPVVLEEQVDEDCQRDGQFIICGSKRFDTQGRRVVEDIVPDTAPVDLIDDENTFHTPTPQRTDCTINAMDVICQNGWQAKWPNDPIYEGARCQTMIIAGVGQRIVCRKKDQPLLVLVPNGVDDKPVCTRTRGAIGCTDGSTIVDEVLNDETICLMPRVETQGNINEAIRCIDECEGGTCVMCEEILSTRIVCEDGTKYQSPVGCYFPQGIVHIFDDASAQDMLNRNCNTIKADVLIAPKKDSEVYIDARLLRALSKTRVIMGSLIIQKIDLPPNQADRDQYLRLDIPLAVVSQDVVVQYSKRVPVILPDSRLIVVGGSLNWEIHEDVVALDLPKLQRVLKSLYISSNPRLDTIAFDDELTIDGQFVMANLTALDPCDLVDWMLWSFEHANSTLILSTQARGTSCD